VAILNKTYIKAVATRLRCGRISSNQFSLLQSYWWIRHWKSAKVLL